MFQNYLITATRNLLKYKLFTLINILGLAIGVAACILIILFVRFETSYDKWIPDADRIFRVHSSFEIPGRSPFLTVRSSGPMRDALANQFPEVEAATHILQMSPRILKDGSAFYETVSFVDPSFFDVFRLPFAEGSADSALPDTNSILLSETMARKYFGDEPAVGQVLTLCCLGPNSMDMHVTGVIRDLPENSHMRMDIIGLIERSRFAAMPSLLESWTSVNTFTYLKLRNPSDAAAISDRLPDFLDTFVPVPHLDEINKVSDFYTLHLMPILDIHLDAAHQAGDIGDMRPLGSRASVIGFSAVAVLILIIACINFINLSTARSSRRAREVSLRKVVGAFKRQIIVQYLGEAFLLAVISVVAAFAIVELALPFAAGVFGRELDLSYFGTDSILLPALLIAAVTGIIGGVYPAFYLSRFRPSRVLQSNQSSATDGGSGRFIRNGLVVAQFAVSIGLIAATAAVYMQTRHATDVDLGYDSEDRLILRSLGSAEAQAVSETLRQRILQIPGVVRAARSSDVPTDNSENNTIFAAAGIADAQRQIINYVSVDFDYFDTMGIRPVSGRGFSRDFPADSVVVTDSGVGQGSLVLNESAALRLGYSSPQDAVGRLVRSGLISDENNDQFTVVGVIPDVQFRSAHYASRPSVFFVLERSFDNMTIQFDGLSADQLVQSIEPIWKELLPNVPFNFVLLDDLIANQYAGERGQATMLAGFAILAVIVSALGLFGLAAFTAERRTMEIGVRKVLGARVGDVVKLLTFDFAKPVLVANLIAWPLAYLLISDWLEGFSHRIGDSAVLGAALAAAVIALLIAWLTVGAHAFRAASAAPIKALRYE